MLEPESNFPSGASFPPARMISPPHATPRGTCGIPPSASPRGVRDAGGAGGGEGEGDCGGEGGGNGKDKRDASATDAEAPLDPREAGDVVGNGNGDRGSYGDRGGNGNRGDKADRGCVVTTTPMATQTSAAGGGTLDGYGDGESDGNRNDSGRRDDLGGGGRGDGAGTGKDNGNDNDNDNGNENGKRNDHGIRNDNAHDAAAERERSPRLVVGDGGGDGDDVLIGRCGHYSGVISDEPNAATGAVRAGQGGSSRRGGDDGGAPGVRGRSARPNGDDVDAAAKGAARSDPPGGAVRASPSGGAPLASPPVVCAGATPPAPPPRSAKTTESKSLAAEADSLLGRAGVATVGRRCASYAPSLEELKRASFSEYVRGEVLGVPLPGYEFLYVYEDREGRVRKSVAPMGQVPPPGAVVPPAAAGRGGSPAPSGRGGRGRGRLSMASARRGEASDVDRRPMRTRSRSRTIETLKSGRRVDDVVGRAESPRSAAMRPREYRMCWQKLKDGIAKVSLPPGFCAKTDGTARGRLWAKGSKLGDTVIPSPIKQALSGIGGVYEYTLLEQPAIAVADFRTQADEYRKRHVGTEFDDDDSDDFCDALARKFWRRLSPTMEPSTYGADMEGTLFRDAPATGWNVDRLETCLCLLRADAKGGDREDQPFHLPGVTSAYLYFGMWASAFAAHAEDMNLLSINYLHAGAPKYWYAVAQEDARRFESLARSHFPGPAAECDEFLRHKQYLLSPAILKKAGIKFTTCVQRPGDASECFFRWPLFFSEVLFRT
ncbi:hypothetical protein ACHAWF_012790 [Thalassiosira exigua]